MTAKARHSGFTLIEFMISVALMSILVALGLPNFLSWIKNTKTRTVAESLANGLRLAQSEATRRSHPVRFIITSNNQPSVVDPTPSANGLNWSVQTVPLFGNETSAEFIEKSQLSGANAGITMTATAPVIVFNSIGRLTGQYDNPPTTTPTTLVRYDISVAGGDRPLRVTVAPTGQVRLCDPNIVLSSTTPTGCPAT